MHADRPVSFDRFSPNFSQVKSDIKVTSGIYVAINNFIARSHDWNHKFVFLHWVEQGPGLLSSGVKLNQAQSLDGTAGAGHKEGC